MSIGGKTEFISMNKSYIKPRNFRAEGNIPECFMHTLSIMSQKEDILCHQWLPVKLREKWK